MNLQDLVQKLDNLFEIQKYETDPFSKRIPLFYGLFNIDWRKYIEKSFEEKFNGLMIKGSNEVQKVYCITFPTPDVLEKILLKSEDNILLFSHHPLDMEISGRGFLPIEERFLKEIKKRGISVYTCHAPMDGNRKIGTNEAIVEAFGMKVVDYVLRYYGGMAGRIAELPEGANFETFCNKCKEIFGIQKIEVKKGAGEHVKKVMVVAGGGNDVEAFKIGYENNCDLYLTGDWFPKNKKLREEDRQWLFKNKKECKMYTDRSSMSFIGVSHGCSEFLVMKTQFKIWLEDIGLKVEAIPQENWWR